MCVTTEDFKEFIGDGKYEGLVLNTKLQRLVALKLFFLMKTFHLLTIMKIIAELNVKIISYDKSKLKIFIVKSVKKKLEIKKKNEIYRSA